MRPNKISCIGADLVGSASCAIIAFKCPEIHVTVLDDKKIINQWNCDDIPCRDPELIKIIKNCRNRNLFFRKTYNNLKDADMVMISHDPPLKTQGTGEGQTVDLKFVENAARLIALYSETDKIIVDKTNIPLRAAECISLIVHSPGPDKVNFEVLSNPEFFSQGSMAADLMNPQRILIGCENNPKSRKAASSLSSVYEAWVPKKNIIISSQWDAEISKISSNMFLAQRVATLNALSTICEELGVATSEVIDVLKRNPQIGNAYLNPSLGFGGFQKEILSFVYMCRCLNLSEIGDYWMSILKLNEFQKHRFSALIKNCLASLDNKTVTIWGFAFKENSCEIKNSPAIDVCQKLLADNAKLKIYDPGVPAKTILEVLNVKENSVEICENLYNSVTNSNVIVLCTPWKEFLKANLEKVEKLMNKPSYFFDGRALIEQRLLKKYKFHYYSIGLKSSIESTEDEEINLP